MTTGPSRTVVSKVQSSVGVARLPVIGETGSTAPKKNANSAGFRLPGWPPSKTTCPVTRLPLVVVMARSVTSSLPSEIGTLAVSSSP